jgi:hypothetical protein
MLFNNDTYFGLYKHLQAKMCMILKHVKCVRRYILTHLTVLKTRAFMPGDVCIDRSQYYF